VDKGVAAGLLLMGGAITVKEAREMAGLEPLNDKQVAARRFMLDWCKKTGVAMKLTCMDAWNFNSFWEK